MNFKLGWCKQFKFSPSFNLGKSLAVVLAVWTIALGLLGCSVPQVTAIQRLFPTLTLEWLGEARLPKQVFQETQVGGLSGLTYDRQRDRFYALSDDPGNHGPARFYTLKVIFPDQAVTPTTPDAPIEATPPPARALVQVEDVTLLKNSEGENFKLGTINPEAIALSPQGTLYIASEGLAQQGVPPFVAEFDLATGQWRRALPMPRRYLRDPEGKTAQGIEDNAGFEALTLTFQGATSEVLVDPYRVFTATEVPLVQDRDLPETGEVASSSIAIATPSLAPLKNRFLHYLIQDGPPLLIAEHIYPMDFGPQWSVANGLVELIVLDQGNQFLSLERSLGLKGYGARLFQVTTAGATDTSTIASLKGDLPKVKALQKRLLLDLSHLGIPLENLEGMALGPRLPDGSQSLILVSDDNFQDQETTQFLFFRLRAM